MAGKKASGLPVLYVWLLAAAVGVASSPSLAAAPRFNGGWLVRIAGTDGDCALVTYLAFAVADGHISYIGRSGASADGTVTKNGDVTMHIVHAGQAADATGRLDANSGKGKWTDPLDGCGGTWTAQKQTPPPP